MAQKVSTVVVTGANRGIGLGFAHEYIKRGWNVYAVSRRTSPELQELQKQHHTLKWVSADVSDAASVEKAFKTIKRDVKSLELLINNAGQMGDFDHIEDEFDMTSATKTLQINTLGPLLVSKNAMPMLKESQNSKIIHITSGLGSIADNQNGAYYIYRISKAGLNMLNKTMSIDLKPFGITCVAICPGWVKTDMGGIEAPLSVEDSVVSMVETIDKLNIMHTGSYIKRFGESYPF